jgi:hypothetical protein
MNQQERDVISGIFDRLKQVEGQPRDSEAEAFIAERIKAQPYAPYVLAQVVHVQEEALTRLKQQVDALEAELEEARRGAGAQASGGGGFLSSLFGGGGASEPQQAPRSSAWSSGQGQAGVPGRGPNAAWQNAQQPDQMGPGSMAAGPWGARGGGGGFLSTALTTAAGVAGGMVVGNMLGNLFGTSGHGANAAEAAAAPDLASANSADAKADAPVSDNDPSVTQAAFDDTGDQDFGATDNDLDFGNDDNSSDWV